MENMIPYVIVNEEIHKKVDFGRQVEIGDKVRVPGGGGLENLYLSPAYDCIKTVAHITDDGELKKSDFVRLSNLIHEENSIYPIEIRFAYYLNSLVGYSLAEFLLHNDLRKLKRCPICNKFYVAKRINQIYCTPSVSLSRLRV